MSEDCRCAMGGPFEKYPITASNRGSAVFPPPKADQNLVFPQDLGRDEQAVFEILVLRRLLVFDLGVFRCCVSAQRYSR